MNYKGFTMFPHFGGWMVRVDLYTEYLMPSKEAAMSLIDSWRS